MEALRDSLLDFLGAGWNVIVELMRLITDRVPLPILLGLLAWILFWTFAVNWVKLRQTFLRGGIVALILVGLVAVLVWGTIDPPEAGRHSILGLRVSNYVGKTVYVTGLYCIMFLCGTVQLTGCCARCCRFADEPVELESGASSH